MSTSKVACPICGDQVNESDINLHLDLQCSRGAGPSSRAGSARKQSLSRSVSLHSNVSMDSDGIVEIKGEEPRMPKENMSTFTGNNKPSDAGTGAKAVASIFTPSTARSQPRYVNGVRENGTKDPDSTVTSGRPKRPLQENSVAGEKKPRLNPLTANQPLAERSRPSTLASYIGQEDLVGPGSLLRARIEAREGVGSCILWGPPGSGKTTLARLIAKTADADFKELSATSSGTADVRQVFEQAKNGLKLTGRKTILMVDEIHRFNKSQQDLFLPYVENGWVQLIGATTENPSFKVNGALLSRCQVFTLSPHTPESLEKILSNALTNLPSPLPHLPSDLVPFLADVADGDARQALNGLELALKVCDNPANRADGDTEEIDEAERRKRDHELMETVRRGLRKGYDRSGEERYDMISALHKCLRGSDGSAAMYWLARMITGGEDPLYIARRLVVVASEDVGLADNHALPLATATYQACQQIGLPECRINLAHLVAYLAEAPKSTRSYNAYKRAEAAATQPPLPGVPLQIRNAPTKLMKKLGYGKEYAYNPNFVHPVHNEYLPFTLAQHSTFSHSEDEHFLKNPEAELREKEWDEDRLADWEWKVQGGKGWEGRMGRRSIDARTEDADAGG